jgi:hypothetical protein
MLNEAWCGNPEKTVFTIFRGGDGRLRNDLEITETTEERQERLWDELQYRKTLRRVAKVCSLWVGGVAFAMAVIAGYAELTDAAVITGAISLGCTTFGVL